jgi:hypothetical protein
MLGVEESYQTPKRIFLNISENNDNKLLISDYVFPDETSNDIQDRIKELFNFKIKNDQIIYLENFPRNFSFSSVTLINSIILFISLY